MPTYEYACNACGNRFEMRQGFDSKPKQKCPQCGKIAPRLLSTPAVVFKGSGFYKTEARGADTGDSDSAPTTPTVPDLGAAGHGHSHGPGGHTHDTPAATPSKDSTSTDSTSGAKSGKKSDASPAKGSGSATEGAAAG